MKKILKITCTSIVALGLLAACNTEETPAETSVEDVEENTATQDSPESEEATEDENEDVVDEVPSTTGEFEDQLDLRLGDTAQVADTLGTYEITIHSASVEDEIEGESSGFDYFIVVDLTVKNIGKDVYEAYEIVDVLDLKSNLEGSGSSDYSNHYESINGISGELAPGEEISGQAIFHARDREKQYIVVRSGLVASGAVKNNAVWTIEKSEME